MKQTTISVALIIAGLLVAAAVLVPKQLPEEPHAAQASEHVTLVPLNVTLTNADTAYSLALPDTCVYWSAQARTAAAVRYSNTSGLVATSTAPYLTIKSGGWDTSPEKFKATGETLYFASSSA